MQIVSGLLCIDSLILKVVNTSYMVTAGNELLQEQIGFGFYWSENQSLFCGAAHIRTQE